MAKILSYLDARDLWACKSVNQDWSDIITLHCEQAGLLLCSRKSRTSALGAFSIGCLSPLPPLPYWLMNFREGGAKSDETLGKEQQRTDNFRRQSPWKTSRLVSSVWPLSLTFYSKPANIPAVVSGVNDRRENSSQITTLSTEVVVNILANLAIGDLLVCKHVCKRWRKLVVNDPELARAAYRSCHPRGYRPILSDTIKHYLAIRPWLDGFSEQGSAAVIRLDGLLDRGAPYFPEELFFAIANLLDDSPIFTGRLTWTRLHRGLVSGACFSPDEQHLLHNSGHALCISSFVNGCWQDADIFSQRSPVVSACFSPDSKHFVAFYREKFAIIWAFVDGHWQQQVDWFPQFIRSCPLFNANATCMVAISLNSHVQTSRLIDDQWQLQTTAPNNYSARGASFHPQDPDLLATYWGKNVTLWRAVDGEWQQYDTLVHTAAIANLQFSPDGSRLLVQTSNPSQFFDAEICVWLRGANKEWQQEVGLPATSEVDIVNFSPRSNYILASLAPTGSAIWHYSGGKWNNIPVPESELWCGSRFSADERYVITDPAPFTSNAIVWKCMDGQLANKAVIHSGDPCSQICYSPHGNHAVTISDSKTASIWGVVKGRWQEKATLIHTDPLLTVSFSPHGSYVLTTTWGKTVNIWTLTCKDSGNGL